MRDSQLFHLQYKSIMWTDKNVLYEMRYHQSYEKDLTGTIHRRYLTLLRNRFVMYLCERNLIIYKQSL